VSASVDRGFLLLANPKHAASVLETVLGSLALVAVAGEARWQQLWCRRSTKIFSDHFERPGSVILVVVRDLLNWLSCWWHDGSGGLSTSRRIRELYGRKR